MQRLVGRYELRERIGEGAMADVFRAHDPQIQRDLVIKVLKPDLRQNPEYVQRFLREAKAAGALSHPHIVTIYDVGEAGGIPYIAMELLDGRSLDAVMAERRFDTPEVLDIALQLAEALRYAHAAGVVHRDIKPSNIMLSRDGRSAKILDFGIARLAEQVNRTEIDGVRTQVGQVLGTPRYMSPEQALGAEIDGRSDLFSLGVVLYELISGRKAFSGASAATLALQIVQSEPTPLLEASPESPRGLQFIVNKLMAKRPERRFADGKQLLEALRREQGVLVAAAAESAQGKSRSLPLAVRTALVMGALTAVVLGGAVGGVLNRQEAAMQRMALTSGSAVSTFIATNAALRAVDNASLPADQRDWLPLQAFVQAASADRNVRSITVVDADGVVRGSSDPSKLGVRYRPTTGEGVLEHAGDLKATRISDGSAFRFTRPILYAGQRFGAVDVALNEHDLLAADALSKALMGLLALVVVGVVAAGGYITTQAMVRPIRRLKSALADATGGDLDFRISHHRRDEFGELFDGFNALAARIQADREGEAPTLEATTIAPRSVAPPARKPTAFRSAALPV